MGLREDVLALADEIDGVSIKDNCEACFASGTELCRGDLECAESAHKACAKRLRAIAEKDADDVTTMSAYDLLPEDERKAIDLVRRHGGFENVAEMIISFTAMVSSMAKTLGRNDKAGTREALKMLDEISKRSSSRPDGCCSPGSYACDEFAFRDEERGEDVYADKCLVSELRKLREAGVKTIASCCGHGTYRPNIVVSLDSEEQMFRMGYECELNGFGVVEFFAKSECPAHKALASDGEPLMPGETVYSVETGESWTVSFIDAVGTLFVTKEGHVGSLPFLEPEKKLTHTHPVLAADGKPLKEGERVWNMEIRQFGTVEEIFESELCGKLVRFAYDGGGHGAYEASKLTHEQPDDWSRWREDLGLSPVEYADRYRIGRFGYEELDTYRDLVRRARKLAEKESR